MFFGRSASKFWSSFFAEEDETAGTTPVRPVSPAKKFIQSFYKRSDFAPIRRERGIKFVFLGGDAVGKTSICRRYVFDCYTSAYIPTVGCDIESRRVTGKERKLSDEQLRLFLWDVAPAEIKGSHLDYYLKDADAIFLVFSYDDGASIKCIDEWGLVITKYFGSSPMPVFLLGNKCEKVDIISKAVIQDDALTEFVNRCGYKKWFKVSCFRGRTVRDALNKCLKIVLLDKVVSERPANSLVGVQEEPIQTRSTRIENLEKLGIYDGSESRIVEIDSAGNDLALADILGESPWDTLDYDFDEEGRYLEGEIGSGGSDDAGLLERIGEEAGRSMNKPDSLPHVDSLNIGGEGAQPQFEDFSGDVSDDSTKRGKLDAVLVNASTTSVVSEGTNEEEGKYVSTNDFYSLVNIKNVKYPPIKQLLVTAISQYSTLREFFQDLHGSRGKKYAIIQNMLDNLMDEFYGFVDGLFALDFRFSGGELDKRTVDGFVTQQARSFSRNVRKWSKLMQGINSNEESLGAISAGDVAAVNSSGQEDTTPTTSSGGILFSSGSGQNGLGLMPRSVSLMEGLGDASHNSEKRAESAPLEDSNTHSDGRPPTETSTRLMGFEFENAKPDDFQIPIGGREVLVEVQDVQETNTTTSTT